MEHKYSPCHDHEKQKQIPLHTKYIGRLKNAQIQAKEVLVYYYVCILVCDEVVYYSRVSAMKWCHSCLLVCDEVVVLFLHVARVSADPAL